MLPITWLDPEVLAFPSTSTALTAPDGLLAAGGQLSPEWLIYAYTKGIFPWFSEGEPILWWSPSPRTVIPIDQLHVSKSLTKTIRKQSFHITFDHAFEEVVEACAEPRANYPEDGTWISDDIVAAYSALHQLGYAHSIEVWDDNKLIGGVYGVALGKIFFGESMFSRQSNSSKIALFYLAKQLKEWQYIAIDCQVHNNHLESMGALQMPRPEFEALLQQHVVDTPNHWNLNPTP